MNSRFCFVLSAVFKKLDIAIFSNFIIIFIFKYARFSVKFVKLTELFVLNVRNEFEFNALYCNRLTRIKRRAGSGRVVR